MDRAGRRCVTTVAELFENLSPIEGVTSESGRRYVVRAVPHRQGQFVARNDRGRPAILIQVEASARPRPPIALQNVYAAFGVTCELDYQGQRQVTATVVECLSDDRDLQAYFVSLAQWLLGELGSAPSSGAVRRFMEHLVTLLERVSEPARGTVQGLVAELMMVALSPEPRAMLDGWRATAHDHFDFVTGPVRLEVKSSANRVRRHLLSAEQCATPPETVGLLASIFVEQVGGGLSLGDLIMRIEQHVQQEPEFLARLHDGVAATLGSTLPQALRFTFDEQLARHSFALFDLSQIPALRPPFPPEISMVHFTVDLSQAAPLGRAALRVAPSFIPRPLTIRLSGTN